MPKKITIPETELYDPVKDEFVYVKKQTLTLEHSLVSVSKWEAKWHKAFLTDKQKTWEESLDYIRHMTITQNVDDNVYRAITPDIFREIFDYIEDPMTATVINDRNTGGHINETPTSELIYYWMIALAIPMECQKWHLNRLLTLIKICSIKNTPSKKGGPIDISARHRLNAARRSALHSRG